MELATLEISQDEAIEQLAQYEQALRAERNTQDEAIAMGYRAAARGLPVISLSKTISAGGWFGNGLPRLAVGRCVSRQTDGSYVNETKCKVSWSGDSLIYFHGDWNHNRGALVGRESTRVPVSSPPDLPAWKRAGGETIMPLIPPRHRPKPRRLRHCHILWEVDEWTLVPPHDPALIRHIRGDLWAVLAVWDLTELERAVLAM